MKQEFKPQSKLFFQQMIEQYAHFYSYYNIVSKKFDVESDLKLKRFATTFSPVDTDEIKEFIDTVGHLTPMEAVTWESKAKEDDDEDENTIEGSDDDKKMNSNVEFLLKHRQEILHSLLQI